MASKDSTKITKPSKGKATKSGAKRQVAGDSTDTCQLTTHQKRRRLPKNSRNVSDEMDELFQSSGEKAREGILSYTLRMHERFPSTLGEQNISSLLDNFDRERAIESHDPVSFDDAISRVRQDIRFLINDIADQDPHQHFFSPLPAAGVLGQRGRITLEDLEAQWMSRWVEPPDGPKRGMDEWSKLIGFVGEYLVMTKLLKMF